MNIIGPIVTPPPPPAQHLCTCYIVMIIKEAVYDMGLGPSLRNLVMCRIMAQGADISILFVTGQFFKPTVVIIFRTDLHRCPVNDLNYDLWVSCRSQREHILTCTAARNRALCDKCDNFHNRCGIINDWS